MGHGEVRDQENRPEAAAVLAFTASLRCAQPGATAGVAASLARRLRTTLGAEAESVAGAIEFGQFEGRLPIARKTPGTTEAL